MVRRVITGLIISGFSFVLFGCATNKFYHGVEATDLSGLFYGMERLDAEKITGTPKREFQCDSGCIVTYVYNRGNTGCVGEGRCDPDDETKLQSIEIVTDVFTLGAMSAVINKCITPCQEGHLELFFDNEDHLIGVRESPTDRDDYCWTGDNDSWQGYPCSRIYNNRRSSSVSETLILEIQAEDIPDKICDQFTK